nr:VCBS repeat-containing protein [candidate division Zixibacteria bacterium]
MLAVTLAVLVILGTFDGIPANAEVNNRAVILEQFKSDNPGAKIYNRDGCITRLYGAPLGTGKSPEKAAENFIAEYSEIWGVRSNNLVPGSRRNPSLRMQPVMYLPEEDRFKFSLIYYTQYQDGIPVYGSELKLLVRNEPGCPIVLASSSLRDLGDFKADPSLAGKSWTEAEAAARAAEPGLTDFGRQAVVVWAGRDGAPEIPRTAVEFIGRADDGGAYHFIVDPVTSEVLSKQSLIFDIDITGSVQGMATEPNAADICNDESPVGIPYAKIKIGADSVFTDQNGDFIFPHNGSTPVNVTSSLQGQYFVMDNLAGGEASITTSVSPPGPVNFIHNETNGDEFERAQVNAYYYANEIRDLVMQANPLYPGVHDQTGFLLNVNAEFSCQAAFNGQTMSIILGRAGEGCSNAAFQPIIQHEYGHYIVLMSGNTSQCAYHEGMGDCMAVLYSDMPELGLGFYGDCNSASRTADNDFQYPCEGEIHYCGQLLSGCIWDTRNELAITEPDTYRDIIADLTINSILVHVGIEINPEITIDFLTLDDDDGNLGNGTPHYAEIAAGFGAHGMDAPRLVFMSVYPERNAVDVPLSSVITVTFDESMDSTTVTTASFLVRSNLTGPIDGTLYYNSEFKIAAFVPGEEFAPGDLITVTLTPDIETSTGEPLVDGLGFDWSIATTSCGYADFIPGPPQILLYPPDDFITADFDGDGTFDIASYNTASNKITVSFNDGTGLFTNSSIISCISGSGPSDIQTADFDGDGDLDLVTTNYLNGTISVYHNDGYGDFPDQTHSIMPIAPWKCYPADFNNDGVIDLAVGYNTGGTSGHHLGVVYNSGSGTFSYTEPYSQRRLPSAVKCADISNDGIPDIIATHSEAFTVAVLLSKDDGTFAEDYFPVPANPTDLVAADLDLDGDLDLAVSNKNANTISVLMNMGIGIMGARVLYDTDSGPTGIAAADWDGDGDMDLITANRTVGTISVFLNIGDGTFSDAENISVAADAAGIVSADFDGEGSIDIATIHPTGSNLLVTENFGQPPAPILYAPVDGKTLDEPAQPTLRILSVPTAFLYWYQLDNDSDFSSPIVSAYYITDTAYTIPIQLGDGTYYWRVAAGNNCGVGSWSEVRHIVVLAAPPPSCPVLYSYDGTSFVEENPLLTACELSGYSDIVTDYYLVTKPVVPRDGRVVFQLRELEDEITYLDNLELITVDHDGMTRAGCTVDGQIFTFRSSSEPISVIDQDGKDWTEAVTAADNILFHADQSGYLMVTFPASGSNTGLSFSSPQKPPCLYDNPTRKIAAEEIPNTLMVERLTSSGNWVTLPDIPFRTNPGAAYIMSDIQPGEETANLTVRISWNGRFATDEIRQYIPADEKAVIREYEASDFRMQTVNPSAKIRTGFDGSEAVVLEKGDLIELSFKVENLSDNSIVRDFIIRATGRYQPDYTVYSHLVPAQFRLHDNYPNPFNPATIISYDLPVAAPVNLDIYNVLGQRVRSLVDDIQPAGHHNVRWDGTDYAGSQVASGIYFYRLTAGDYTSSKKMILQK